MDLQPSLPCNLVDVPVLGVIEGHGEVVRVKETSVVSDGHHTSAYIPK